MNVISHEELKLKIDRGDDFRLVMVLNEWAFSAKHIPGSINVTSAEQALERAGFTKLSRFAGGISDWESAGYPLEGDQIPAS